MKSKSMAITTPTLKETVPPEAIRELEFKRSGLATFIAQIPKPLISRLGKILGHLLYYVDVPHRRIVRRNLQFIHPEWSADQFRSLSVRTFKHFGITILEMVQMYFFAPKEVLENVQVEGQEYLIEAYSGRKGVVLISAHLGNWEMSWHVGPCYFQQQITGVAKRLRNAWLDRVIHNLRTRFGNRIIYKKGALPDMMQTLRRGEMVGILMDISRRFENVEVEFLGRRATATPAAALLALRCKCPVITAFCHRDSKGKLIVRIEPPVEIKRTNNLRTDLQTNTQLITDRVEQAVRKNPEQWFWALKRWKDFYPNLYPESKERLGHIKRKARKRRKSSPSG
jgi:KDO2-lipid IV(A) lauroyltransferase